MTHPNEVILKSPRVGILHAPEFTDYAAIEAILDQPSWFRADPEYVVLTPKLYPQHFMTSFFDRRYCHYSQFTPTHDDPTWEQLYLEVVPYVTHLLVFMSPSDTVLSHFLKTIDVTNLKVRLVII